MGRKNKNVGRKNKTVNTVKQESCQKLNFLHQAAHAVLAINPENVEMSRFYASTMKITAQKLVFKLDPSIKRSTCKYCHALLIPGVTARVRVRRKRERHIVVTCVDCQTVRRYLCRADYVLWSERGSNNIKKMKKMRTQCKNIKHKNRGRAEGG
ncbi:Ribonuclease P protein subunit p21 [Desmophyllum pertusum]|uniref:Ribonuclease P protein subunit p21 n=1 Tax=Desmophyllum pertusum TaxID=174260 RepID=A0A9X0CKT6_9CNID|nr:Ribonuclease P protein subunit p21 [Desmophyllum pertusum]